MSGKSGWWSSQTFSNYLVRCHFVHHVARENQLHFLAGKGVSRQNVIRQPPLVLCHLQHRRDTLGCHWKGMPWKKPHPELREALTLSFSGLQTLTYSKWSNNQSIGLSLWNIKKNSTTCGMSLDLNNFPAKNDNLWITLQQLIITKLHFLKR